VKFIIDGDGTVSYRAAYDLLKDAAYPYIEQGIMTVTCKANRLCENVAKVLNDLDAYHFVPHNQTTSVRSELTFPGDKVFIVVGAATRKELVNYCLGNNITVLDLEKGLYPVTERIT